MHGDTAKDLPALKILPVDGLELAVWEWPGDDPTLLFAHATGFHGRCWDHVARQFPRHRRVAVDFRGHGRSSRPDPPYHWPNLARDLVSITEQLNVRNAIGIGHSMGGYLVVAATAMRPETFAALLLVDPTIFPRAYYGEAPFDASYILRRRNNWGSSGEMFESFRGRSPFVTWQPEVLRDYCEFALRPNGDGFELACPPTVETSIYEHSNDPESNLYSAISGIAQPVVILRAGRIAELGVLDLSASPTAPELATTFPCAREVFLRERNHYIPMEAPELVVEEIRRLTS